VPARLVRNLRKGHVAEDIGVSVLRGFSAVATARHQDDIGVDAFAILLRQDGKYLYAGSTFGVQFKSQSIEHVDYDVEQTKWFIGLDIPLFFAKVDAVKCSVSFHTPVRWNSLRPTGEFSRLRFLFDGDSVESSDQVAYVGMSPPILTCTESESRTDEFATHAYDVFSAWNEFERRSNELRKYRTYRSATWETGGKPAEAYTGSESMHPDRFDHLDRARPILNKLAFHALGSENSDVAVLTSFLRIHEWYKSEGFEDGALDSPEVIESSIDSALN